MVRVKRDIFFIFEERINRTTFAKPVLTMSFFFSRLHNHKQFATFGELKMPYLCRDKKNLINFDIIFHGSTYAKLYLRSRSKNYSAGGHLNCLLSIRKRRYTFWLRQIQIQIWLSMLKTPWTWLPKYFLSSQKYCK